MTVKKVGKQVEIKLDAIEFNTLCSMLEEFDPQPEKAKENAFSITFFSLAKDIDLTTSHKLYKVYLTDENLSTLYDHCMSEIYDLAYYSPGDSEDELKRKGSISTLFGSVLQCIDHVIRDGWDGVEHLPRTQGHVCLSKLDHHYELILTGYGMGRLLNSLVGSEDGAELMRCLENSIPKR